MKKNIILLLSTLILGLFFLEFAASHEINNLIKRNGFTKELIDFIDSLSHNHIAKIQEYIENLPTLKHDVAFQCVSCKAKNEVTLRGLQDFFV